LHENLDQEIIVVCVRFDTASITISGIELAEKIKKSQFKTGNLAGRSATAPAIWAAVLAA
jgi:hypothetical protein